VASALGAGSNAQAVAGSNLTTLLSATVAPNANFARSIPAGSATGTIVTAIATDGGNARAQTWGINNTAISTALGAGANATSVASGQNSNATSAALNGGFAAAIASGNGVATAIAERSGGSVAIANAAGNGKVGILGTTLAPSVVATATSTDLLRGVSVGGGLLGLTGCGAGAHGYATITDNAGTMTKSC